MIPDLGELAEVLRDAARAEVVPRFRRLDQGMVRQKSEAIDLVTEADEAAEVRIAAEVARRWPNALFVGEESVAARPGLLDELDDAPLAVVVDPVDGTANFAAGLPLFGTMAAVVANGETVGGIVYDPMGDDWMLAERGGGTWLRRPDGSQQRQRVAVPPTEIGQLVGTAAMAFMPGDRTKVMGNLAKVRVGANYRTAAHEYRLLAGGHTHYATYYKILPWDHLAGTLLVEEAGGYAARYDGLPYLPVHRDGGLLLAADKSTWEMLRREVFAP